MLLRKEYYYSKSSMEIKINQGYNKKYFLFKV